MRLEHPFIDFWVATSKRPDDDRITPYALRVYINIAAIIRFGVFGSLSFPGYSPHPQHFYSPPLKQ